MNASLVLLNGCVATMDPSRPFARGVAVEGSRIVAVGAEEEVAAHVGPGSAVVDLAGRMLLPGFVDAHVHPFHAGLRMIRCDLTEVASLDAARERIRASGGPGWILGGGWAYEWFERGCPSAAELDALTGDVPAYLVGRDGHTGWANTVALAAAGVTASTPDPPGGRIERRSDGSPQGSLHEEAMDLVEGVVPSPSDADLDAALDAGIDRLLSEGVTAFLDAWVTPAYHRAYLRAAAEGRLPGAVRAALSWDRSRGVEQVAELEEMRAESTGSYRAGTVKLMLDGVVESFTASLHHPYVDGNGGVTDNRGIDLIDPAELGEIVAVLDRAGFQCHVHAIGDAAVTHALDAFSRARSENGWADRRHTISHLQVVDPADIPRFHRLGVVAAVQGAWACLDDAMTRLTIPFLGAERAGWQYPFGSLHRSGAILAVGSDWPVSTPSMCEALGVATTRRPVQDPGADALLPQEALSLPVAIAAATAGSAYAAHLGPLRGTLSPGSVADLVVLDRDPFEIGEVGGVSVDLTVVGGVVRKARS